MNKLRIVLLGGVVCWFVYYFFIKNDNSRATEDQNTAGSVYPVSIGMTLQKVAAKLGKPVHVYHFTSGKNDRMELLSFKNSLTILVKNDTVNSINSSITNGLLEVFNMRDSLKNVANDTGDIAPDTSRVAALLDSVRVKRKADSAIKK